MKIPIVLCLLGLQLVSGDLSKLTLRDLLTSVAELNENNQELQPKQEVEPVLKISMEMLNDWSARIKKR